MHFKTERCHTNMLKFEVKLITFYISRDTLSLASCGVTSWILAALALFAISEAFPNVSNYFLYPFYLLLLKFISHYKIFIKLLQLFPQSLVMASKRANQSVVGRYLLAVICVIALAVGNLIDTVSYLTLPSL